MRVKHSFNMVEILIALGVCAIGVCSVMVLFPVGASASRDAAMETYAANAADQMLHLIKYQLIYNKGQNWNDLVGISGEITDIKPADENFTLEDLNDDNIWKNDWINEDGIRGTVYRKNTDKQVFQILSHRNDLEDKLGNGNFDLDKIDFRSIMTVWKEQITIEVSGGTSQSVPYSMGVRLNVKVSWPAELPDTSRQYAYYTLEVFKP